MFFNKILIEQIMVTTEKLKLKRKFSVIGFHKEMTGHEKSPLQTLSIV